MAAKTKKKTPMPRPKPAMTEEEKKRQKQADAMARYNAIDSEEKPEKSKGKMKKRYGGSVKKMARGGMVKGPYS
tara:strand:+ start:254 stop:475 length:222 start_codon:yes stop_codon:yes gene_type:complete